MGLLIPQRQFDAETAPLHGVIADDFVLLVGDIQHFRFEAEYHLVLDVEIMADENTLVSVGI